MSPRLVYVLSICLVVIVALVIIDHMRSSKQMEMLHNSNEKMNTSMERVNATLQKLNGHLERGATGALGKMNLEVPLSTPVSTTRVAINSRAGFDDPVLNGIPRLGTNFLLPPMAYHFDPAKSGGTLKMYKETPKGINSIKENAATNSDIDAFVLESLCGLDLVDPQKVRESLAVSCIITDDFKVFTFKIRPGVYWHIPPIARQEKYRWLGQRTECTAEDFAFFVRLIKDPNVTAPHLSNYYEQLTKAEVLDRYTLRVVWAEKLHSNLDATFGLRPMPRHVYCNDETGAPLAPGDIGTRFNQHWFDLAKQHIGTGPYQIDLYEPDNQMIFTRFLDYWGTPSLHFDRMEWNLRVKEPGKMMVGLKGGDVHFLGFLLPQDFATDIVGGKEPRFAKPDPKNPKIGRTGELGWERYVDRAYSYVGWNQRRPFFTDRRVRLAMGHCFNRERMIKEAYHGLGRTIDSCVHPDTVHANRSIKPVQFDLVQASRLLDEAGWTDSDKDGVRDMVIGGEKKSFQFTLFRPAHAPTWDRVTDIFTEDLAKVGIKVDSKALEWPEMLKVYESKDFDAVTGGWQLGFEPDFMQIWHSSEADKPGSSNKIGFKNAKADELILQLRRTFDPAQRVRICQDFQAIIAEEQPYTFFRVVENVLTWQAKGSAQRQALGGVTDGIDTFHPLYNHDITSASYWFLPR